VTAKRLRTKLIGWLGATVPPSTDLEVARCSMAYGDQCAGLALDLLLEEAEKREPSWRTPMRNEPAFSLSDLRQIVREMKGEA
jgi:hypothetical protein